MATESGTYTPETIARRLKIAQALLGDPKRPITHWAEGLNELAKGYFGGKLYSDAERGEKQNEAAQSAAMMGLLGGGSSAAPAAPAASPAAPMAPEQMASPDINDKSIPAAIRYNNPGAQWPGPSASKFGSTDAGVIGGGNKIAAFSDPVAGAAAQFDLLGRKYAGMPLGAAITKWSGGNNAPAYIAAVSQATGVSPDTPITPELLKDPKVALPLAKAMAKVEAGRDYPMTDQQWSQAHQMAFNGTPASAMQEGGDTTQSPLDNAQYPAGPMGAPRQQVAQVLQAPPQMAQPQDMRGKIVQMLANPNPAVQRMGQQLATGIIQQQMTGTKYGFQTLPDGTVLRTDPKTGQVAPIYQTNKPQFVPNIGVDRYGQPQPGFVDATKGTARPAMAPGGQPTNEAMGQVAPEVTGEEYLKTLDKPRADQVKAMVEGRLQSPGSFALKTPYWQRMLQDAAQYEPGFDFTKWGQRAATAKDFASGKSAQNVTSFNTVLGHLNTLDKAVDELGNTNYPSYNSVANWLSSETGNTKFQAAKTNFETARQAVVDELTRAFRGTGGNVHDIVEWTQSINSANSPAALHAATKQAAELLNSRIEAMGDMYNRGMNKSIKAPELLSQKARDTLTRLSGTGQNAPQEGNSTIDDLLKKYGGQ